MKHNDLKKNAVGYKTLVTTYEETRAGFVALALEKNRIATPFVEQARSLKVAVAKVKTPEALMKMSNIRAALLKAAAISDKAENYIESDDKDAAIKNLVDKFLKPAGREFREELVYRFLLTKGDSLGGSIRNIGGVWAKKKFANVIIAQLKNAGIDFKFIPNSSKEWRDGKVQGINDEIIKGISWKFRNKERTILFDMNVNIVKKNVDICLFSIGYVGKKIEDFQKGENYLALGELKGGIDPAGADEHWKTGSSALSRIKRAFEDRSLKPKTFFVAAAIEEAMAKEIWEQVEAGVINKAANLNKAEQLDSLCEWLIQL